VKNNLRITLILLFLTGCGVFNKKDLNDEKLLGTDEHVDFNASGKYDLSEYLFPSESKTLIYNVTTYNKNNNSQNINETVDEYVRDVNIVKLNDNISYEIEVQAIQKKELIDGFFYDNRKYRRHLNIGDVYYSFEYVELKGTKYRRLGKLVCKVENHLETEEILNKNYKDILKLFCTGEFFEGTLNNSYSVRKNFKIISFYAKQVGLIGSIFEKDETTTTGNEDYREDRRIEKLLSN